LYGTPYNAALCSVKVPGMILRHPGVTITLGPESQGYIARKLTC